MDIVKRNGEIQKLIFDKIQKIINFACDEYTDCQSKELENDLYTYLKDGITTKEIQENLIRIAVEKTSITQPNWQYVAGKLSIGYMYKEASINRGYNSFGYGDFYDLIKLLIGKSFYGEYIIENYTSDEIYELGGYIVPERDFKLNYTSLKMLDRYVIKDVNNEVLELPQELFMGVAMHLAMNEKDKVFWAKQFYDVISELKVTVATPTLNNARKPFPQLSSCFIDTAPDNLWGIYNVDNNFSQISKHGGGMGIYLGKIRSSGSDIRGHKNVARGVIPWIKNYNNTAVAVDQLGVRAGACAVYLDVWHKDILDFLNLKTNNGDERMKAHDVFPGVCIPDLFMEKVKKHEAWYLFDPREVLKVKGYSIEDSFGEEWNEKYLDCVNDIRISKVEVNAIDIMKKILISAFETGTPFIFFRDIANKANPNKHKGIIYCSNLCTEICQNTSPSELIEHSVKDGIVTSKIKSGDFVVCNLSSINLGAVKTHSEIEKIINIQVRMLDNVIDLNLYPVGQAEITNKRYRGIGLGVNGYHHWMAENCIDWESEEHLNKADELFEHINYCAIKASMNLASEKESYEYFNGSDWENGKYFENRDYNSEKWVKLKKEVNKNGLRNGWILAIAPTSSTSMIAGTTAGIDPIFSKFWIEEKKNGFIPRTAPNINQKNIFYYKEAHNLDQKWSILANAKRQRHIDQSQSFNMYITPEITAKDFMELYFLAWEKGIKTIYYCRNKSLEVEDCAVCSS